MPDDQDVMQLRYRVMELESKIEFLYRHLNVTYQKNISEGDQKVIAAFQKGGLIEAIKVYREINRVDLASAKKAVEDLIKH